MRTVLGILAMTAAAGFGGAALAMTPTPIPGPSWLHGSWLDSPQVEVKHAAARLVVIAEPRNDISVTVSNGRNRLPQLAVRRDGGRIVVDGGLGDRPGGDRIDCHSDNGVKWVRVGGYGRVDYADLPLVTAHVPLDARVAGQGAVYGQIGATRSLGVAAAGCGDWATGPVRGAAELALTGSGDLGAADMGSLKAAIAGSSDLSLGRIASGAEVELAGSGDVHARQIDGPLLAQVAGSGDLDAGRLNGPVRADIAGSGDVRLHAGYAPQVTVRVSGSGDFVLNGEAGRVEAAASGSGGVHIDHARGPVSQTSTGSAEITIGR